MFEQPQDARKDVSPQGVWIFNANQLMMSVGVKSPDQ
jgi:hypothetical protein